MNSIGDSFNELYIYVVVLNLSIFIETKNIHSETCFLIDGNYHPRVSVFNKAFLTTTLLITNPRFCSTLVFLSIVIA